MVPKTYFLVLEGAEDEMEGVFNTTVARHLAIVHSRMD